MGYIEFGNKAAGMPWEFNDGGRKAAGYKGFAGDCAVRAMAIAMRRPYAEMYGELREANESYAATRRNRVAKVLRRRGSTPRNGNFTDVMHGVFKRHGWLWTPTMGIGTGCTVRMEHGNFGVGRYVLRVSRHFVAVIDGVAQDTHDPSRNGRRCVYGYWCEGSEQ